MTDEEDSTVNPEDDPVKNPHKYLEQTYNEILETSKNNTSMDELNSIQRFFYNKTSQVFKRHYVNLNKRDTTKNSRFGIISSNVGCCKRQKTHGTKAHWAKD